MGPENYSAVNMQHSSRQGKKDPKGDSEIMSPLSFKRGRTFPGFQQHRWSPSRAIGSLLCPACRFERLELPKSQGTSPRQKALARARPLQKASARVMPSRALGAQPPPPGQRDNWVWLHPWKAHTQHSNLWELPHGLCFASNQKGLLSVFTIWCCLPCWILDLSGTCHPFLS